MHGKCDLCVLVAVHRVPVSIGDEPVKTLDLCQRHHDKLLGPVLDAIAQYGAPPQKIKKGEAVDWRQNWKRKDGPFKCRVESCARPVLKHAATLEVHLRKIHGLSLFEYTETYGPLVTATPEERAEPITVECPQPGCEAVYSTRFGNRWPHTAMISHMRGRHGLNWRPETGVIGTIGEVPPG